MKRYGYLLIFAALVLGACTKDNVEPEGKADDLQLLMDALVRTDASGNITGYLLGDNLNAADPSEISAVADSYEEALEMFLDLLPPEAAPAVNGKTYTWDMTDGENKSQGQAVFSEGGSNGAIATLTVNTTASTLVHSVRFIPERLWPENTSVAEEILEDEFFLGAVYHMEKDMGFGKGDFVVVREWSKKNSGLMIQIDNKGHNDDLMLMKDDKFSAPSTLHAVSKALHAGNSYETIVKITGKEQKWPDLDNWFCSNSYTWTFGFWYKMVNLETDKEKKIAGINMPNGGFYKIYVYCFKPDGDKIKFW